MFFLISFTRFRFFPPFFGVAVCSVEVNCCVWREKREMYYYVPRATKRDRKTTLIKRKKKRYTPWVRFSLSRHNLFLFFCVLVSQSFERKRGVRGLNFENRKSPFSPPFCQPFLRNNPRVRIAGCVLCVVLLFLARAFAFSCCFPQ